MNHTMKLTIRRVEGAMIRALGLIERRGFAVTSINATENEPGHQLELIIGLRSADRSVDVLARQVEKLFDVCSVSLLQQNESALRLKESMAC